MTRLRVGDELEVVPWEPAHAEAAFAVIDGNRAHQRREPFGFDGEARGEGDVDAGRRDEGEGDGPHARTGRGAGHVEMTMTVRLTLDAGAPFLRIAVAGENRARDHRLRVRFSTGIANAAIAKAIGRLLSRTSCSARTPPCG